MAASVSGVLEPNLQAEIQTSKVLVVGAGGIGCELMKNLVLTGFTDIEIIDLDTIDISNLNRQFLFHKEHVGKSKAQVAKDSVIRFNPDAKIVAYHDSITSTDYDVEFFKKFTLVMNALDNRAARNHVNRLCLAANIPLIESGTAGYLGQVTVIKKGLTECYECQPKPTQKTFPGCTIRNTPSEPIHCVVWAKHLFNQLFGEEDPDQDVSPDTEDPELTADAGESALNSSSKSDAAGGIDRKSTRAWAHETGYDFQKLFNKLFHDDIKYLLSMEKLWEKRKPPSPLVYQSLPTTVPHSSSSSSSSSTLIKDQQIQSIKDYADVFSNCLSALKTELSKQGDGGQLVWDKDDDVAMDFVTATSNIRAHIFGIPIKSRFDIKSMAGNIIPAIATTNAIIAGLIVIEALKILSGNIDKCKMVYLNRQPASRKQLLAPCALVKPNPKCYVCAEKPEVTVVLNTTTTTIKTLEEKIVKGHLGMVEPDVEIDDGKGTIIITSEEGETEENNEKMLSDFNIGNGTRLKCDDFLQNYNLVITIQHVEKLEDNVEFLVSGDAEALKSQQENKASSSSLSPVPSTSKSELPVADYNDDLIIMEEEQSEAMDLSPLKRKRKVSDQSSEMYSKSKKSKQEPDGECSIDSEIIVL
ncbi:SUMO-activating enzyme subunit 2 [Octopus sinensis]|uniref:SUMO-activating enzyme subunit n=1 Tax=Octopus sinensis TaxID=2607531 RepID=A0A6P7SZZ2_9MOLL|nr:SUMO-activating enzyme subunit 2 [Octopus sinensis]